VRFGGGSPAVRGGGGGWWPVAAPVRSCGWGVGGIRALGPSQKQKRNAGVELTEEGNGGGALAQIQRGRRCFGTLDWCTGLTERGRMVPVSLGAERGRGMKERGGAH
jgi:hypothetical protein